MSAAEIRPATAADMERLDAALRRLSDELGDPHRADAAALAAGASGPHPSFAALIAERDGETVGVAMVSPVFSTMRGGPGLYLSDLWVAPEARSERLGERLIAAARERAEALWGGRFVKLTVYDDNPRARAFYERLGFRANPRETQLALDAAPAAESAAESAAGSAADPGEPA